MSVCSGWVVRVASTAPSCAPRSIGPVLSRSSDRDFRRPRRPRGSVSASSSSSYSSSSYSSSSRPSSRSVSSRSRSGIWWTGVAVVTRSPKNPSSPSRTTATAVPTPATSGVPTAQPVRPPDPGRPACGSPEAPTMLGDAEHRGDHAQPADGQPATGLRAGAAAQQAQGGEEQHDRQHHDERADDPAHAAGEACADRADAVAPGRGAEHDRQAEDAEADAVPTVLRGERLGLVRARDRAGQAAGAAGQQAPAAAHARPRGRRSSSSWRRDGGWWNAWRPAASCSQPSSRSGLGSGWTPAVASTYCGQACVGR